jgi:hypothetical protein
MRPLALSPLTPFSPSLSHQDAHARDLDLADPMATGDEFR